MPITVNSIAVELFSELGSPSTTSVSAIESWLTNNIGQLNTYFSTSFVISAGAFTPDMSEELKVGFKILFEIYYLGYLMNVALANSIGSTLEVTTDEGTVRLASRVEIAKTYRALINDLRAAMKDLKNYYLNNNHQVRQVRFADGFYERDARAVNLFIRGLL